MPKKPAKKEKAPKRMGRPSLYTPELANEICQRIAQGESLRSICREERMPNIDTVRQWRIDNEYFSAQYARAREDQADALFEEALDTARVSAAGGIDPSAARVLVDTVKWAAGKLKPKVYSDKLALTGDDGGAIKVQHDAGDALYRLLEEAASAKRRSGARKGEVD